MKERIFSILAALLLSLCMLAFILYIVVDPWLMRPLMERYAPPEDTHLPAEEYEPVVEMICDYLHGDTPVFQHVFTVDGTEYAAFNAKEQQHMADVQNLFKLCNGQVWSVIAVVVIAIIAEFHLFSDERTLRAFRRTLLFILTMVVAIVVLACIDFNSLFILFHKIAFTNDLWLLDPQTDLLIRLMPTGFFMSYAAIIGGLWLAGMGGLLVFVNHRIKITEGE